MSKITTQEMIEWLHRPAWERPHYTVYTEDEVTTAIAARLKALETVAKRCKRDYESPLYDGRLTGSTYEWLCDILDAAPEAEK